MWFGIEACVICTIRSSVRPGKCTQSQLLLTEQYDVEASDQEQLAWSKKSRSLPYRVTVPRRLTLPSVVYNSVPSVLLCRVVPCIQYRS